MGLLRRKPATQRTDPGRIAWSVQVTGRCNSGHQVCNTIEVTANLGFVGRWAGSGQCGACGSDVDLTGWIG